MPKLSFKRHVRHTPDEMISLVSDMNAYPGFVPNCTHMAVRDRPPAGAASRKYATMTARLGPVTQAYTSEVTIDPEQGTIRADAIDGPFSHLKSKWQFSPEKDGTCVRFDIDFGFSNRLIAAVAEPAFAAKQDEIMDAFLAEADRRFG